MIGWDLGCHSYYEIPGQSVRQGYHSTFVSSSVEFSSALSDTFFGDDESCLSHPFGTVDSHIPYIQSNIRHNRYMSDGWSKGGPEDMQREKEVVSCEPDSA